MASGEDKEARRGSDSDHPLSAPLDPHPIRRLVAVLVVGMMVAGCTSDGSNDEGEKESSGAADLLLVEEDVPGAASSQDVDTLEALTTCSPIARPEGRLETFADEGHAVREIVTETSVGTATVVAAVFDGLSRATREEMIFANLAQGIEVCSRDSPIERGDIVEQMTPLTGLPEGAVGYSSQITDHGVPEAVERAYAIVGTKVVVVGARRVDGDETGVDVMGLLTAAIEKVERKLD